MTTCDNMNDDIRREILYCYNNRKLFSKDFIKFFIFSFVKIMELEEAVQIVKFSNDTALLGAYGSKYKRILICYTTICQNLLRKLNTTIEQATNLQVYQINLKIMLVIFHELTHAKQYLESIGYHSCNELVKKILEIDEKIFKWSTSLYNDHYNDFLSEYNADFEAHIMLHNVLSSESFPRIESPLDTNEELFNFLWKHFSKDAVPFERFKKLDPFYTEQLANYQHTLDALSEYDKLSYGISVSQETIQKVKRLTKVNPINHRQYFS